MTEVFSSHKKIGIIGICVWLIFGVVFAPIVWWWLVGQRAIPAETTDHSITITNYLLLSNLGEFQDLFQRKGISQLSQCTDVINNLPELPAVDEQRVKNAALQLQQRLILRQWLIKFHLDTYYTAILAHNVTSLEDVYWLGDGEVKGVLVGANSGQLEAWSTARQTLPTSKHDLDRLKVDLWSEVVRNSRPQDTWTWGSMLVVSLSVAGLVTLAAMTQPSIAPDAKHALLQYVTGKYLLPSNCKVVFHWSDPHPVGSTMCLTVKFYQRNGNSYPISDADNFLVDICQGIRKITVSTELGSIHDPDSSNLARVKFTVRQSGRYDISLTIGNQHLAGSPFRKFFTAGPVSAHRTTVIRHSSTVICTVNKSHLLYIEPRDEYNNICTFPCTNNEEEQEQLKDYELTLEPLTTNHNSDLTDGSDYYTKPNLHYDRSTHKITVILKFKTVICYSVTVTYRGTILQNGDFDLVVLSVYEAGLIQKNIASKNHNICYEAKLTSTSPDGALNNSKMKKVQCYVSPKQLIIKELILKFIPIRLYTFRLCPSTKIELNKMEECFSIDDGCQSRVELMSKDRNVIVATFTQFLLQNIGGSETFHDKRDYFYHEVRKYHQRHHHDKITVRVSRDRLLETSYKATKNFSTADWCKNFEVVFNTEMGVDWGGVRREWFELICGQLFDGRNRLFTSFHDGDGRQYSLVHPNPTRPNGLKLKYFEFAGKIVGKCLYESALGNAYRQLVKARFTRSFLAQVIGLRVHYKYFEQDDPDLYLSKIKYVLDNNIDEIDTELYFMEEIYDTATGQLQKTVDLIPNGNRIRVGNTLKLKYLDALAQYRLANRCRDETDAFLKGLNDLIPDNLLSIFDENELELLLCGTGQYSIGDFKQHHMINGNSIEFRRIVGWFWAAVGNFTQEEMARLLQFTTGCSQLPAGGFKELTPKFQLTAAPTFGNLPTAHTCFNQLCLPDYDSYEHFERSLLLAITEGTEGFGMV